jgi:hypothetical protein
MLRKRARTFEPSWAKVGDETKLPREEEKDQKSNKIKKENRKQIKENPKTNPKKREKSLFDPGRHFPVPYYCNRLPR